MYIGQTCRKNIEKRFGKDGKQYIKCPYFYNAIQKYSWDNFYYIILFENLNKEMANIVEVELIKKYDTTNHNKGYNLSLGGNSNSTQQKPVYQYNIHGNFIKKWESAQYAGELLNIIPSNISACCLGISLTCGKYVWSYSLLEKEYFKEINYPYCRKVKQYDRDGNYIKTFNSITQASIYTGLSLVCISNSCWKYGLALSGNKYRWTYAEDCIDKSKINLRIRGKKIPIVQYNLKGQYIQQWESAKDAGDVLGICRNNISKCCKRKQKTAGGYIWRYEDEKIKVIDNTESLLKKKNISKKINRNGKKVVQYDKNDNFIKIWDKAADANNFYASNKNSTNIQACCRGEKKSAYGYKWEYIDKL